MMEAILVICTLFGGVAALWFFWDKLPLRTKEIDFLKRHLRLLPWRKNNPEQYSLGDTYAKILGSISKRLESDFYISGPNKGQFGKGRKHIAEDRHYQSNVKEPLKTKPSYYLTYWGWYVLKEVSPAFVTIRGEKTEKEIMQRLGKDRWIAVHLEDYSSAPPGTFVSTAKTIRHTIRAAHILLLIDRRLDIVSQIAWDLILKWEKIQIYNGAKEFLGIGEEASLWSSVYVYNFLNSLKQFESTSRIVGDYDLFQKSVVSISSRLEGYFKNQWKNDKWKFGRVPWQVNAPGVLAEIVPFFTDKQFINSIRSVLLDLLSPAGRLKDPGVGKDVDASEYISSVRLAHGLIATLNSNEEVPDRLCKLIDWIVVNYQDDKKLNTHDLSFLYRILKSHAPTKARTIMDELE